MSTKKRKLLEINAKLSSCIKNLKIINQKNIEKCLKKVAKVYKIYIHIVGSIAITSFYIIEF